MYDEIIFASKCCLNNKCNSCPYKSNSANCKEQLQNDLETINPTNVEDIVAAINKVENVYRHEFDHAKQNIRRETLNEFENKICEKVFILFENVHDENRELVRLFDILEIINEMKESK